MLGISSSVTFFVIVAAAALAFALARIEPGGALSVVARAQDALSSRWAPLAIGVLTAIAVQYAWGGLNRVPVVHDESAYVLQAEIFARNLWTAPSPAIPEFFEQLYVLVTPVLASKYPPGHSLVLALGELVELTGLPVVVLNGVTGGLIFALARRAASPGVGLLTWLLYVSCFPAIYFRASYLSEVTSGAGWLAAFWFLMLWRETHGRGFLVGLALSVGVVAITRPMTGVALALPVAVVVLRDTWKERSWRDLAIAVAAGALVVAIIPIWSWRTTGSWRETPLALYTRQYVPFDKPGFGADSSERPLRPSPPDIALTNRAFFEEHRAHTVSALPGNVTVRARMIARDIWYEWRLALAPFALVGLVVLPAAGWFALAALVSHVALYLLYAHPPFWTVYYLESEPALLFLAAVGVAWVLRWVSSIKEGRHDMLPAAAGMLLLALVAIVPALKTVRLARRQIDGDHAYFERFYLLLRKIPDQRAVVFVRYAPNHNDNLSLVRNFADQASARIWIAHDRGADNARLLARAPGRRAYVFFEDPWGLVPLAGITGASSPAPSPSSRP